MFPMVQIDGIAKRYEHFAVSTLLNYAVDS